MPVLEPKTLAVNECLPPGKHLVAVPTVTGKPFVLLTVSIVCDNTKLVTDIGTIVRLNVSYIVVTFLFTGIENVRTMVFAD